MYCYLRIKCCPANSLATLMWRWCLSSEPAALYLRVEGTVKSRRFKEGRKGTEKLWTPDSHVSREIGVKTVVYNTKMDQKKGGGDKNRRKRKKRAKGWRNTTVKRKNSVLSIRLLGHDRGYFLYLCMYNSFLLILSSNIFSLDSD